MNLNRLFAPLSFLVLASACTFAQTKAVTPSRYNAASLSGNARELFDQSMQLASQCYDTNVHLVRPMNRCHQLDDHTKFGVRESTWYAVGLLARNAPGDRQSAAAILQAVVDNQYLVPNTKWFGTFKRSPDEITPGPAAHDFQEFDPNWREFIGTIFEFVLTAYPDRVPEPLRQRLYRSIDDAILGEQQEHRLVPSYTNIALMYGSLWDFASTHKADAASQSQAAAWVAEVNRLFHLHNAFNEFNSPTYYGVDLFGLVLWREFGSTPAMRAMGAAMETILWNQIADFYQPNLRNIAGPYDRSYGMDMESYVAVTGLWMRALLPAKSAPLPIDLTSDTDHVNDLYFAPPIVLLGAHVPPAAMAKITHFAGPHLVNLPIDDQRTATAWIGADAIWGGEATTLTRGVQGTSQFHPVTLQWRTPSGAIGWVQLTHCPPINAVADKDGVTIETSGDVDFVIQPGPAAAPPQLTAATWNLPGMNVTIETDAAFTTHPAGTKELPSLLQVTYAGVKHMRLRFTSISHP